MSIHIDDFKTVAKVFEKLESTGLLSNDSSHDIVVDIVSERYGYHIGTIRMAENFDWYVVDFTNYGNETTDAPDGV
jgi:hypothetical protein